MRFFFQAEDGIRDYKVTGVQTCALPILGRGVPSTRKVRVSRPRESALISRVAVARPVSRSTTRPPGRTTTAEVEIGRASCRERGWVGWGAGRVEQKNGTAARRTRGDGRG